MVILPNLVNVKGILYEFLTFFSLNFNNNKYIFFIRYLMIFGIIHLNRD